MKKQTQIPGTERVVDAELSAAAEHLQSVRAERMELSEQETAAANALIAHMIERKLDSYVDEDLGIRVALVRGEDRVSVRKIAKPKEEPVEPVAEAAE